VNPGTMSARPYLISLFLFALIASFLAPYLQLAAYASPIADDFHHARQRITYGFWGFQRFEYNRWTGRYAAIFYFALGGDKWLVKNYGTLISCVLLVQLVGWGILCARFLPWHRAIPAALLFVLVSLQVSPFPAQTYYWFCAAGVYQIPIATFLISLSLALYVLQLEKAANSWLMALVCFFIFLSCGGNEILTIFIIGVFCILAVVAIFTQSPNRHLMIAFVVTAVLSLFFMYGAPGNGVRLKTAHYTHNIQKALYTFMYPAAGFMKEFLLQFWVWVVGAICFLWGSTRTPSPLQRRLLTLALWLLPAAIVGIAVMTSIIVLYGLGFPKFSGRVQNQVMQLQLLCWIALTLSAGAMLAARLQPLYARHAHLLPGLCTGVFAVFCVTLALHPRHTLVLADLEQAPDYKKAHMIWDSKLRRDDSLKIILKPSPTNPVHLSFGQPDRHPTTLSNSFMAEYYRKQEIIILK